MRNQSTWIPPNVMFCYNECIQKLLVLQHGVKPFHSPDTLGYKTYSAAACTGSCSLLIRTLMDSEGSMLWNLIPL